MRRTQGGVRWIAKTASAQRCFYAALRIKRLAVQKKVLGIFVRGAVDIHARPTLRSVGE
jgi:hypothetical protein